MSQQSSPEHIIDLADRNNCEVLRSLSAGAMVAVKVIPAHTSHDAAAQARATRSEDGTLLTIVVTSATGEAVHTWTWEILTIALHARRRRAKRP